MRSALRTARDGHLPIADLQSISTESNARSRPSSGVLFKSEYACHQYYQFSLPQVTQRIRANSEVKTLSFLMEKYMIQLNLGQTSDTEKLYQSFLSDSLPVYLPY